MPRRTPSNALSPPAGPLRAGRSIGKSLASKVWLASPRSSAAYPVFLHLSAVHGSPPSDVRSVFLAVRTLEPSFLTRQKFKTRTFASPHLFILSQYLLGRPRLCGFTPPPRLESFSLSPSSSAKRSSPHAPPWLPIATAAKASTRPTFYPRLLISAPRLVAMS